jgi:hypothetical protein
MILPQIFLIFQLGILVDTAYYGTFTFTPWNFYVTNVMEKRAESFGVSSWHFYLSNVSQMKFKLAFLFYILHFYRAFQLCLVYTFHYICTG